MKKLVLVLMFALVMTGCGKEKADDSENNSTVVENQNNQENQGSESKNDEKTDTNKVTEPKGYVFEYNGVKIGMDMEAAPIISALGEADSYFEAPSCAFECLDKTYSYGSFEIDTY